MSKSTGAGSGSGSGTKSVQQQTAALCQERCQALLDQLLKDDDNKYCVDCDAKGPRWASWNLGIFLCIRCAGIHRNLGVHISKVKSVNLDSWTPEQVVTLQQMGNSRARAVYEANLPDSFRRPQTDSALEAFIRAKYEHKKYVAREWVPPDPPQVNWDKEIAEELEKQKKKKKSSSNSALTASTVTVPEKKSYKSDVVPQLLPKPKSSASPKPGRATPKRESTNTADLLGTTITSKPSAQSADDVFSSFLSAPPSEEPKKAAEPSVVDLKSEEESFFNQSAPLEKEKSKMTKDSILALYGQNMNQTQFPQNGAFPTQYQSQSFNQLAGVNFGTGGGVFPTQQNFAPNNSSNFGAFNQFQQPPQQQQGFHNQFGGQQPPMYPPTQGVFQNQMNMVNPIGQFNPNNGQFPQSAPQSFNMQHGGLNNLSQNFGSLSLNQNGKSIPNLGTTFGAKPAQSAANVTTNGIWQ